MSDIRWRGVPHEELYRMINSGEGPRASAPQLDYWSNLDRAFSDVHQRLTEKLGTLNGGWQGEAGRRAQDALSPLQRWAEDVHGHVGGMRGVAQNQADLIADARARMPEPQPTRAPQPAGWPGPGEAPSAGRSPAAMVASHGTDFEAREAAAADAREQAIRVMSNYERNSEINRSGLGLFEEPGQVAVDVPAPANASAPVGYRAGTVPASGSAAPAGAPEAGAPGHGAAPGRLPRPHGGAPVGRVPGEAAGGGLAGRPAVPRGGGWRVPGAPGAPAGPGTPAPPAAAEPPGALSGTVGTAGGLGAVAAGGAGAGGGAVRRRGAHRRRDDREHGQGTPQWPGEQDNQDAAGAPAAGDGGQALGGAQAPAADPPGQAPQQPAHRVDPVQPAHHTGIGLDGAQQGHVGPAVDPVQPVHSHPAAPAPQPAPAAEAGVGQPYGHQAFAQPGQHGTAAPVAPMTGGAGAGGAQGPTVRGQSPLMREATAGNQAFFGGGSGSYGGGYGTSAQSASGPYAQPGGTTAPAGTPSGGYAPGGRPSPAGYARQDRFADPEPEPDFGGGFSEPVSTDTDPFWEDDRRVAPPVLGEFPQQ